MGWVWRGHWRWREPCTPTPHSLRTLQCDYQLTAVLAEEVPLSSDEREMDNAQLLAHWWRRRRGQTKLAWLLGLHPTLAEHTNRSPLAAAPASWLWERQLLCELFEWSGDTGVPLVVTGGASNSVVV